MTKMVGELKLAKDIIARMIAEGAQDMGDVEIERCLLPCVGGRKLVEAAIGLRNNGKLLDFDLTNDKAQA